MGTAVVGEGRGRNAYRFVRDLTQWLAGMGMLAHQTLVAKDPSVPLLATAILLVLGPAGLAGLSIILNGRNTPEQPPSSHTTASPLKSQDGS